MDPQLNSFPTPSRLRVTGHHTLRYGCLQVVSSVTSMHLLSCHWLGCTSPRVLVRIGKPDRRSLARLDERTLPGHLVEPAPIRRASCRC